MEFTNHTLQTDKAAERATKSKENNISMIDHKTPPGDCMTDEQLMQYESHFAVSQPFKDKARFILHERKKKIDLSTNKMTLWILILTIILVVIALKDCLPISEHKQSPMIQPLSEQHTPTKDKNNDKKTEKDKQNISPHNYPPINEK